MAPGGATLPMTQPECFIAYAPRGGGLLCAVTYFAHGDDVAGWYVGLKDYSSLSYSKSIR